MPDALLLPLPLLLLLLLPLTSGVLQICGTENAFDETQGKLVI